MSNHEYGADIHELDVTVWVGKGGVSSAVDELGSQLEHREVVKVRILRAAQTGASVDDIADELARAVDGEVIDVRGHTAVIRR